MFSRGDPHATPPDGDVVALHGEVRSEVRSIVRLTQELVRIPSRAAIDRYDDIISHLESWLRHHGIKSERLQIKPRRGRKRNLGLTAILGQPQRGPMYALDATIDTAPFGERSAWRHGTPTSAVIDNGWLYGRGTADSKSGIAIFCHVAATLAPESHAFKGSLAIVFDGDEHTGRFAGMQQFVKSMTPRFGRLDGVMVGYPGNDSIGIGSRGFLRAVVTIHGESAHSGASDNRGANAIVKASKLVNDLHAFALPHAEDAFPLPPKLTVTCIRGGGEDFSSIPDRCTLSVDIRLTPSFDAPRARALLRDALVAIDRTHPTPELTQMEILPGSWPAYQLSADSRVAGVLVASAEAVFGVRPRLRVVGPSNIGNYLASEGVDATSGFGVTYRNIHATNECIEIESIDRVYRTYLTAVRALLTDQGSS